MSERRKSVVSIYHQNCFTSRSEPFKKPEDRLVWQNDTQRPPTKIDGSTVNRRRHTGCYCSTDPEIAAQFHVEETRRTVSAKYASISDVTSIDRIRKIYANKTKPRGHYLKKYLREKRRKENKGIQPKKKTADKAK